MNSKFEIRNIFSSGMDGSLWTGKKTKQKIENDKNNLFVNMT